MSWRDQRKKRWREEEEGDAARRDEREHMRAKRGRERRAVWRGRSRVLSRIKAQSEGEERR